MDDKKCGFLIINKPVGPTSHDIINQLRKITGIRKIGHAGTLDPFASGVLIVAVGREATKRIDKFVKLDKEYVAKLKLGAFSNTYDRTGGIKENKFECKPEKKNVSKVLLRFVGKQKQIPPMFSAKKVQGKKLYELARKGIEIKRRPVDIEIYNIKLLSYKWPFLKIKIKCSSGTYIRSLTDDIGKSLGTGAYLESLERTAVGKFKINKAVELNNVDRSYKNYYCNYSIAMK